MESGATRCARSRAVPSRPTAGRSNGAERTEESRRVRSNSAAHDLARTDVSAAHGLEPLSQFQMPTAGMLDQRPPNRPREAMAYEQMPEAVGALVQIAHGEI